MDLGLEGKVALVAASSRGLGRAVAEQLGAEGATLALCSRDRARLEEVQKGIEERYRVRTIAVAADLSEESGVARVVDAAHDAFGRVDVLFTNTGGPPAGPFESHSLDAWRQAVKQNLESVLLLVGGVLPGMKERGWGRIINVTSIAVKEPLDGLILSNSIRSAVTGFARTLANEVGRFGITVNNVLPGWTMTDRMDKLADYHANQENKTPDEIRARWANEIPVARLGKPEDFAAMVAFLASERAGYVTGQSITVDGGFVRSLL
jgi:3-oxoacyl-[acyl-carrier protein] reductase